MKHKKQLQTKTMNLIERLFTGAALILGMLLFFVDPADAQSMQELPTRVVSGVVLDQETGGVLSGASVSLYNVDYQLATVVGGSNPVISGSEGNYSFTVVPGVYRLEVKKDGFLKSILSQTTGDTTSGFFYVNVPNFSANMPLLSTSAAASRNIDESSSLFVNPDGTLSTECTAPPEITDIFPIPNSKVKNLFPTIQFKLKKGDPSIKALNKDCIKLFVNDKQVTPTITGNGDEYTVTYQPVDPVGKETKVRIEACDTNAIPNKLVKEIIFYSDAGSLYSSPDVDSKLGRIENLIATGEAKYYLFFLLSMVVAGIIVHQIFKRKKT